MLEYWTMVDHGPKPRWNMAIFFICRMTPCWCTKHFGVLEVPLE